MGLTESWVSASKRLKKWPHLENRHKGKKYFCLESSHYNDIARNKLGISNKENIISNL